MIITVCVCLCVHVNTFLPLSSSTLYLFFISSILKINNFQNLSTLAHIEVSLPSSQLDGVHCVDEL